MLGVVARHSAVLDAAVRDGVEHVVYTSLTGAGDHLGFALDHRVTERLVEGSGPGRTVLRNGLYAELVGVLLLWAPDSVESASGVMASGSAELGSPRRASSRTLDTAATPGQRSARPALPRRWPRTSTLRQREPEARS